jgi:hypothetical protein
VKSLIEVEPQEQIEEIHQRRYGERPAGIITKHHFQSIASNAKAIEALGNQAAEDRSLIRQVGESAQQVAGAVARLVDIIQVDRERLARQENISQSLLERLNCIDP